MNIEWKGVMPAVTTKFTPADELDLPLFEKNIRFQLESGVHGIILGGTLGEASTLTFGEKETLLKETVRICEGKVPVVMNIAEQSTKGAIAAAKAAKDAGASGLMMLPPMRYKASSLETVVYFSEVAASTDLPIMIYNNPIDYGIEVTPDMFEQLLEYSNIQAVKESTRDVSNVTRLYNRFGERLKILTGVDTLAMESLVMGAHGWVAGLVCAFPRETVLIYELIEKGEVEAAREIFRWFLPLLELDIDPRLVQNIKMAEVAVGYGSEYVRAPRLPLSGENRKRVQQIINEGLKTKPQMDAFEALLA